MNEKTVKIGLSSVVVASIGIGAYYTFVPTTENSTTQTNNNSNSQNTTSTTNSNSTTTSSNSTTTTGQMKDGTYTGEVVRTRRGDVQLSITVTGGKITEITPLIYPNEDRDSKQINADAIPKYVEEAINIQNANITLISGATETYNGFTGSLQDAINKALQ